MSLGKVLVRAVVALLVAQSLATRGSAVDAPDVVGMRAELTSTAAELDDFWQSIFLAHGLDYRAPQLVMEAAPLRSACTGETWFAAYCPIGMELHIDPADVADRSGTYGPGLAALTLGHEWTHHVITILYADDALMSALEPFLSDVRIEELLADCQAGAFVATLWGGNPEETLLLAGARAFLADNASDIHGDAAERTGAFDLGYERGIVACGLFPSPPANQPGVPA